MQTVLDAWRPPSAGVAWTLGVMVAALVLGTLGRSLRIYLTNPANRAARWSSLLSWWALVGSFVVAILLGPLGAVILIGVVSLLALREFFDLVQLSERGPRRLAYAAAVMHYALIWLGWTHLIWTFLPVFVFMALAGGGSLTGKTRGYRLTVGSLWLGMGITVFFLSHAAMTAMLPEETNPVAGAMGWFVLLLLLTETNDISQAFWGRRLGRRKITPVVSPNKTWEGFLGGVATTVLVALLLGPWLTPLGEPASLWLGRQITLPAYLAAALVGLAVALVGFVGDLVESSIKRDLGVKDSGNLLPGQGGIFDRTDSLTFTAPVYYHLVLLFTTGAPSSHA